MSSSTTTGLSPTDVVDEDTAAATVEALLLRLRRVEFLLAGTCDDPVAELYALRQSGREHAIKPSLHALERDLSRLVSKSRTVKDILELHAHFPEIFRAPAAGAAAAASELSPAEKAATVLAAAPEFHTTASQVKAIMDTPVPEPASSAALIELLPRIQQAEVVQDAQAKRIAELRRRSLAVMERWYLVGVEGANSCFAEWDERTFWVDKQLSRRLINSSK